jgi:hypothetical protein
MIDENRGVDLLVQGRYPKASDFLRRGLLLDPSGAPWAVDLVRVHGRWAQSLCAQGHFDKGQAVLDPAAPFRPEKPYS